MYGAISAGVRGVKRDTLTRGREPAAASSGGKEREQVTPQSPGSFNSETGPVFPTSTAVYHKPISNTVIQFLAFTLHHCTLWYPSADTKEPSQAVSIRSVFPMQVVNSGEVDLPLESPDR